MTSNPQNDSIFVSNRLWLSEYAYRNYMDLDLHITDDLHSNIMYTELEGGTTIGRWYGDVPQS